MSTDPVSSFFIFKKVKKYVEPIWAKDCRQAGDVPYVTLPRSFYDNHQRRF